MRKQCCNSERTLVWRYLCIHLDFGSSMHSHCIVYGQKVDSQHFLAQWGHIRFEIALLFFWIGCWNSYQSQVIRTTFKLTLVWPNRAVARSENPGGHVVLGGDNVPPLVEIGLTDLPKSGDATPWARATNNVKKP